MSTADKMLFSIVDNPLTRILSYKRFISSSIARRKADALTIDEPSDVLKDSPADGEKSIILVIVPEVLEALIDKGEFSKNHSGEMGAKEDRAKFNKNVSANPEEVVMSAF